MSERNLIQSMFDDFAKAAGAKKKSGSWYHRGDETVLVLNLQKSNYATRYYVNVALWLLPLGDADAPKENKCHVRTRLTRLVPEEFEGRVEALFDLDINIDETTRRKELSAVLREHLLPVVEAVSSLDGLRSGAGQRLIQRSLVTGPAQRLLQGTTA